MSTTLIDDSTGFDEPVELTPTTSKAALAITDDIGRIGTAVSEFDRVAAGLADIEARYPKDVVYDLTTTKGMKDAIAHRAAWRDPRITVEKVRKMAKAPLLALGKNIDARAAWLTERLLEGETPIDQQIKAEEARREAEREAKAAAEFGRVLAIQEALAAIGIDVAAACNKTSDDIAALLERMQTTEPEPATFQEMLEQAKAAWAAGIAKLETAHKAKLWEEAEQRRVAAEQEAARVAAEQAAAELERLRVENERIAAEQRAERERMADACGPRLEGRHAGALGYECAAIERGGEARRLAYTDHKRRGRQHALLQRQQPGREPQDRLEAARSGEAGGLANAEGGGRREERADAGRRAGGDPAQGLTAGPVDGCGPVNGYWASADWVLCRDPDGPTWRPVEPGTFPLAHGAPARVGRLRAYGNAINAEAARIFIEATM
ncbi:hypothetical protein [Roseateles sp. LKC17W]|uniref:Uncharacterized protein n=1 Tax=Pelomonas margarita TaxID=3299031 RepID=A0ABW7FIH2_9BURK